MARYRRRRHALGHGGNRSARQTREGECGAIVPPVDLPAIVVCFTPDASSDDHNQVFEVTSNLPGRIVARTSADTVNDGRVVVVELDRHASEADRRTVEDAVRRADHVSTVVTRGSSCPR